MANPHDFHSPKPSYTRDDLILSSQGGYFGPGNAQLPAPPMLMMDRITELSLDGGDFGNGHAVAELDIVPDLWFFACHFEGDPVMPGCLGLDAMWQLLGYWLGWSGSPGKGAGGRRGDQVSGRYHPQNPIGPLRGQRAPGPPRGDGLGGRERAPLCGRCLRLRRIGPESGHDQVGDLIRRGGASTAASS